MSLRGSQTSMKSFTLKPAEPDFLKTSRSAWTPQLDPKNNNKLFLERVSLITHWHDKWNERQRKQLVVHLLQRTRESEMLGIRAWIMKKMPEPQWRVDPSSVLPKWLVFYIFSFLTTAELCRCSQVSSHWQYLSEQDLLWRPRTAARGWYLPYNPPHTQHGAWKQYYVTCVTNANRPSNLQNPGQEEGPLQQYNTADLARLGKFYVETEEPDPEPVPVSRMLDRPNTDQQNVDHSLYKDRWIDPNKYPKDLDNWDKLANQEYEPDIRYLQKSRMKSKSYTKLENNESDKTKKYEKIRSKSTSTLTEIYTQQGPFRLTELEGNRVTMVTKKGVEVPKHNYWLQKPQKQTLPLKLKGKVAGPVQEKSGDIGCGAVWGENIPGHAHPRILLISSDVPAYELIVGAVLPGVIGIVYDSEKSSLRSILNQLEHSLNGRRAESIGVFAPGRLGYLNLTQQIHISGSELQVEFWRQMCGMVLEPKFGGRIDIFSSVGVSTVNQTLGLDIIYRLTGATSVPFNAPIGGIYGEWAEICGTWLLHPDHIHPVAVYLREEKIRAWVLFSKQLDNMADDMRLKYTDRLQIQHTAGMQRVVNAVVRQGLELLPSTEHTHLADVLFYCLSKLSSERTSSAPTHETEQVKRGVLCMRLVDVLLSSQFVKDLEEIENEDEEKKEEEEEEQEDVATQGKDILMLLEWMKRSVPYSLQTNSHRLIYPKGIVVDQRMTILEELIRTERTFVRNMGIIERELYTPLDEAATESNKPILNSTHIRTCFTDLRAIYQVHKIFLERLEKKQDSWTADQTLGDTFLQLSQRFDCYSNYINNYPSIIAIYRKNLNQNPAFWGFKQNFDSKNANRTKFFELLLVPMERMGTIQTLVSSLTFYTPSKHQDCVLLQQSSSELQKLTDFIAQSRKQYAHLTELRELEQRISGCPILTDTKRAVLAQVAVYRVKSVVDNSGTAHTFPADKKFPYFQKFQLYLFDDSVVLTRVSFEIEPFCETARETYNFVNAVSLSAVRVRNTEDDKRFVLYTPQSVYLFECRNKEEMKQWVDVINTALLNAPKLFVPNIYTKPDLTIKTIS